MQAPYVIDAIGDPHTLATALDFDGGFIEEVESVGGEVQVEELDNVEIASTGATARSDASPSPSSRSSLPHDRTAP